jgi:hypothetical protein
MHGIPASMTVAHQRNVANLKRRIEIADKHSVGSSIQNGVLEYNA